MRLKHFNKSLLSFFLVFTFIFSFSGYAFATDDLGTWVEKTPMGKARGQFSATALNGKVYVIGGFDNDDSKYVNTVEEYDPITDKWTTKAPMHEVRSNFGVAALNGKVYAIGGSDGPKRLNTVEEYDPITDKWTTKAPMGKTRFLQQVTALNGKVYVIGGHDGSKYVNTVEEYDPITDKWTTKAPMHEVRSQFSATALNGKVYAMGGFDGSKHLNTVEEYDPITNKWTTKAPMHEIRYQFGATALNGKVYAIGGGIDGYTANTVEEYDPITNKWTTKAPMPEITALIAATALNGKVYAIGGNGGNSGFEWSNNLEEYTPAQVTTATSINLTATPGDTQVNLSWNIVQGTTSYNVKRSETPGGPYTQIANVNTNSYTDTDLKNGKTYYYIVTPVTGTKEGSNSNEASATPSASSTPVVTGNKVILEVTMTNNSVKEYDLSATEIAAFLKWYEDRSSGTGKDVFAINKSYNIKPFIKRTEYLNYDKIYSFEVKEYNQ